MLRFIDLTLFPSIFSAVQNNDFPESEILPVYSKTLEDVTFPSHSGLHTSVCVTVALAIFAPERYHCILEDGRPALVVQVKY